MECDSIMDISINLNIDDISTLNEMSMELSTPATPSAGPGFWMDQSDNKTETTAVTTSKSNAMEKMQKFFNSLPNGKLISENVKANLAASIEKQKTLEAEVVSVKMKLEAQKKALAEENSKLQAARGETKTIESKLVAVQNRIKKLTKELEDMNNPKDSSDKENVSDKSKFDLYRSLSGVTFDVYKPNSPNELKGFVSGTGSSTNFKTFSFNTAEHSHSLIGSYIWNVLEDMNMKNWKHLAE